MANTPARYVDGRDPAADIGRTPTPAVWLHRWRLLAAVLMVLAAGCGGPELAAVEGLVTLDGKPLPEVEVVFVPDSEKGNNGSPASAYTDGQGRYKLHSEKEGRDGAVVGPHRVRVIDITAVTTPAKLPGMQPPGALAKPDAEKGKEKAENAKPSRVPAIYTSVADTPFRPEVRRGPQTIDLKLESQAEEKPAP